MVSYDVSIGAFCNDKKVLTAAKVRICDNGSIYSSRAPGQSITQLLGPVGTNVLNVGAEMVSTVCTIIGEMDGHAYTKSREEEIITCMQLLFSQMNV